jgi:hypothetical protein
MVPAYPRKSEESRMNFMIKAWREIAALLLAALLFGCSPTPTLSPTSTPQPTIDVKPTMEAVATQAIQTAVANMTLSAPSATPVIPTNTSAPTNTPAPTDTPAPTNTATHVFIPWTKTPTPTEAAYACSVISVYPTTSDTIKVNQDFDGKWTVKNIGVKTWLADNVDIHFVSGDHLQKRTDLVDMTSDVAPDGTYTVVVDMKPPADRDGTFSTTWAIALEDGTTCTLNMKIKVTK